MGTDIGGAIEVVTNPGAIKVNTFSVFKIGE